MNPIGQPTQIRCCTLPSAPHAYPRPSRRILLKELTVELDQTELAVTIVNSALTAAVYSTLQGNPRKSGAAPRLRRLAARYRRGALRGAKSRTGVVCVSSFPLWHIGVYVFGLSLAPAPTRDTARPVAERGIHQKIGLSLIASTRGGRGSHTWRRHEIRLDRRRKGAAIASTRGK